ncbi:unnamed protein product [Paramecium sonneborni]|uniref:Uncharacterized protein n=1 Tax=Paramecium sonneborni TaxID=65129 RepID=A0A8S1RRY8_9CILI|nr:unnamed protein product [Paramecium sonneborni]
MLRNIQLILLIQSSERFDNKKIENTLICFQGVGNQESLENKTLTQEIKQYYNQSKFPVDNSNKQFGDTIIDFSQF